MTTWLIRLLTIIPYLPLLSQQAINELALASPTSQLPATREKYASSRQLQVSRIAMPSSLPDYIFQ